MDMKGNVKEISTLKDLFSDLVIDSFFFSKCVKLELPASETHKVFRFENRFTQNITELFKSMFSTLYLSSNKIHLKTYYTVYHY